MLAWEQIERLQSFDSAGTRVLSACLDVQPTRRAQRSHRLAFEDLVRDLREQLAEPARKDLAREVQVVHAWFDQQAPGGRGLALFSCEPRGFWHAQSLAVPIRDHVAFDTRPDVAPLVEIADEYERYAVAVIDKRRARLFAVFAGEIEEREAFTSDVPGKHDQGALAQNRFQRHHEAHVHRHLQRVVEQLSDLLRRRAFDRLIVAGPEEATSELRRLLPRAMAPRLVAVIPGDVSVTDAELLEKTLEVERGIEAETERRLVGELREALGRGRATQGLRPTLEALWLGEVQTLFVADDIEATGGECTNCHRLEPGQLVTCPACGSPMQPVADLVHRAIALTLDQSGRVEIVHGQAAEQLKEHGGVGALLRFRVSATQVPVRQGSRGAGA